MRAAVLLVLLAAMATVGTPRSGAPDSGGFTRTSGVDVTHPLCAGFAPGTTFEYMAEIQRQLAAIAPPAPEFNTTGRWPGTQGTPVTLTYSFVPDGTPANGGQSQLFTLFNQAAFGGDADGNGLPDWQDLVRQMFDRWTEVTGNTYIFEPNDDGAVWPDAPGVPGVRGDIRITTGPIDEGGDRNGNTWAFNFFPAFGGDMLIDEFDIFVIDLTSNDFRRFRNLISHEHGHGVGMLHVCPASGQVGGQTKLMEPFITTAFDGPQLDDILGSQLLYGDRLEPNDTMFGDNATSLADLGAQSGELLTVLELSLHPSDADLFTFEAGGGSTIQAAAAVPVGTTYLEGDQLSTGCEAGTPFNALNQKDLVLELLDSSGNVLASFDEGGLGAEERMLNVDLPTTDTYFLRVTDSGQVGPIQAYELEVFLDLVDPLPADLTGDGKVDGSDLGLLLLGWGTSGAQSGADLNGSGLVDGADLGLLLLAWTG